MRFIYHGVPDPMIGMKLIPLNQMPDSMSEIRNIHLSKYKGREEILDGRVPLLNCLWNDVIQLLPFHPRVLFDLQVKMKLIPKIPDYKYFQIDLTLLDPNKTVVFFKDAPGEDTGSTIPIILKLLP